MNELRVDDRFSRALEEELVSRVQKASPARARKRIRIWLGAGVLAGAGVLGGVGATAAGLFVTPGFPAGHTAVHSGDRYPRGNSHH